MQRLQRAISPYQYGLSLLLFLCLTHDASAGATSAALCSVLATIINNGLIPGLASLAVLGIGIMFVTGRGSSSVLIMTGVGISIMTSALYITQYLMGFSYDPCY